MAFCPHLNTQKKPPRVPKPIRRKPKGISMRAEKESICPPKNVISSKKIIRFARERPSDCPFACQTVTALSALMSLLYRPHAYKRDISLLATADFHALSRFFCRDFLGFLFLLPILEPSFYLLRAQHASETGYIFNVLSFVRDRQTVTVSVRYFRH